MHVSGLRRAFGSHVVLDGLDLDISAGEFVALVGRSGGGKTTLLRSLDGLDRPDAGSVPFPGPGPSCSRSTGCCRGSRSGATWPSASRPPGKERARAALAEVGLAERADAWPLTLSGGEAQRASLARALVREPELLLLDEPFGALDALTRLNMQGLVQRLYRRHRPAVLLVTHDVDEALILADRVLLLQDGRIVETTFRLPAPRNRIDPAFEQARHQLLELLGVPPGGDVAAASADTYSANHLAVSQASH